MNSTSKHEQKLKNI